MKNPVSIQDVFAAQLNARWRLAQESASDRIKKLKRLETKIEEMLPEIKEASFQDLGRHPSETEILEIGTTQGELRHAIRSLEVWMEPKTVETPLVLWGSESEVRYQPRGRTLIIGPWNYPFQLTVVPVISAVAAGNPVVLKPSELAPRLSSVLVRLLGSVFDSSEVAVIEGGVDVSQELLKLPFDHFFYTGGGTVGKVVMKAAAEHLSAVTLELGGKSPTILDDRFSVKTFVERVVWGKFINAGQTCVAPDFLLVPESRQAEVLTELSRRIQEVYGASPETRQKNLDFGRIVSERHWGRLVRLCDESIKQGAKLTFGGERDAASKYFGPTVLSDVSWDSPVMQDEIFGPLLPVLTYRSVEEVMAAIQKRPNPLALYLFSKNRKWIDQLLRGTLSGGVAINDVALQLGNPELPFGGCGASGLGSYHGFAGFKAFSHERSIFKQGMFSTLKPLYPPYGKKTLKFLKMAKWGL